ncbi:MAG: hypothetical protein AAFY88_24720, partial [Acidobacteriota bacterium]
MVLRKAWFVVALAAASVGSPLAAGPAGEISLSLASYQRLSAEAKAADSERARRLEKPEASIDWTDQRLVVEVMDQEAEIVMELGAQVFGRPEAPRSIPIHGFLDEVIVEAAGGGESDGLVVMMGTEGWQAVATSPGEYRLRLAGRIPLHREKGFDFLKLPTIEAPVSGVEVRLAEETTYEVTGAVLVSEKLEAGRQIFKFAVEAGDSPTLRMWPRFASEISERLL